MRARAIDIGCRDRRGQAAGGVAALVLLLALTASWMLGREAPPDVQAGVSVEYFEPAASSRVGGVGPPGQAAAGSTATTGSIPPSRALVTGVAFERSAVGLAQGAGQAGESRSDGGESSGSAPAGAGGRPRLPPASLLTGPDVEVVELGLVEGDFVYRRGVGWCRYEPATEVGPGRFLPVEFRRLPEELRRRYPANRFPPRGGPVPETAGPSAGPVPAESGPWDLEPTE